MSIPPSFIPTLRTVYGPFETTGGEDWTPPPSPEGHKGRYLWTDAFGVLNFITLYKTTRDTKYLHCAEKLVKEVHNVLGYERDGSCRLPGASDENPLGGGLRIGKEEASGPDCDGQYHHYLTLWMFALNRLSLVSSPQYNSLAVSLAHAIHSRFMYARDSPRPRMYWKLSTDLITPLVLSEGNLDPIDGYVVFNLLRAAHKPDAELDAAISDYEKIAHDKWRHYISDDPLDLGMTMWTASWAPAADDWPRKLLAKAKKCLEILYNDDRYFSLPASERLAFREFGAVMGMKCTGSDGGLEKEVMESWTDETGALVTERTPERLRPITAVMYCAAVEPGAFRRSFWME